MPRKTPLRSEHVPAESCTLDLRRRIVRRLPFFTEMPPDGFERVESLFGERGFNPGEPIYHEGDPAAHLYLVATGKVKLLHVSAAGQEVILDLLASGDYFGSLAGLDGSAYMESAAAQTDACILVMPAGDFRRVLERYPAVTAGVLRSAAARLAEARLALRQLGAPRVEQRVAAALLRLGERFGEGRGEATLIQLPLSRQDLAALTSTTPESASRALSQFRQAGWIRSGRGWVSLLDLAALQRVAGEEH